MITIQLRNRVVDLPAEFARKIAANVYEVRVPRSEDLAKRLRARELISALDEAVFLIEDTPAIQSFVSAEGPEAVLVTVILP